MSVKKGHNFYILACTNSIHKSFYFSNSLKLHFMLNGLTPTFSEEDNMVSVLRWWPYLCNQWVFFYHLLPFFLFTKNFV